MKRIHPYYILSRLKRFSYLLVLPVFRAFFPDGEGITQAVKWEIILLSLLLSLFAMQWYCFRYRLLPDGLRIERGVLRKKTSFLPFSGISLVKRENGLLLFLCGCCRWILETGHSRQGNPGVTLFLPRSLQPFPLLSADGEGGRVSRPSNLQILLLAASSSNLLLGLLVWIPLWNHMGKLLGEHIRQQLLQGLQQGQQYLFSYLPPVTALVTYLLLLSWLVSFLFIFLRHANFTSTLYSDRVVVTRGLIFRHSTLLFFSGVTHATLYQSGLLRLFGRYHAQLGCFGHGRVRGELTTILPAENSYTALQWVSALPHLQYQPLSVTSHPSLKGRFFRNPALNTLLAAAAIALLCLALPAYRDMILPLSVIPLYFTAIPLLTARRAYQKNGVSANLLVLRKVKRFSLSMVFLREDYQSGWTAVFPPVTHPRFVILVFSVPGYRTLHFKLKYLSVENLTAVLKKTGENGTIDPTSQLLTILEGSKCQNQS